MSKINEIEKYNRNLERIVALMVIIGMIALTLIILLNTYDSAIKDIENQKLCKSRGYDGIQDTRGKIGREPHYRCFKEISSPTGTGIEKIYSGELK